MSKHFEDMTLAELEAERAHWEAEIANATGWGAGVAAADGFRQGCIAWIARHRVTASMIDTTLSKGSGV